MVGGILIDEGGFQLPLQEAEKDSDTALLLFLAHFIREIRNSREGIIVITEPVGQVLVNVFYKPVAGNNNIEQEQRHKRDGDGEDDNRD